MANTGRLSWSLPWDSRALRPHRLFRPSPRLASSIWPVNSRHRCRWVCQSSWLPPSRLMIGNRAVGSVAVQLAKNLFQASHVVGIAGTDDKCDWLNKIGAHSAVCVCSELGVSNLSCMKQLQKRFIPCSTGGRYGRSRKCSL
jgi:hypothetical protein